MRRYVPGLAFSLFASIGLGCTADGAVGNELPGDDASSGPETGETDDETPPEVARYPVEGHVQKGPFAAGSSLQVSELNLNLVPTGRQFAGEVVDDSGAFGLAGVELSSPFARITADGFYFDENRGELSVARLELHALADLSEAATANVNLLSHLERPRVEYLMLEEGLEFPSAKKQAQSEVLKVFAMTTEDLPPSEQLNIVGGTDADARLLAASVLLQGYRTVGELSELLAAIATDLRTDGALDSASNGSALMNAAVLVNLAEVRANLEDRYASLGQPAVIADFESYVAHFVEESPFEFTETPAYPAEVQQGLNLLAESVTEVPVGEHSLTAELPLGTSVRIRMRAMGAEVLPQNLWFYSDAGQWDVSNFDFDRLEQEFVALPEEGSVHMTVFFEGPGSAELEYFENGSETPTRTKTITWSTGTTGDCPHEQMRCDGVCIETKEDPENCGGCGVQCDVDQTCVDHACI